MIIVGYQGVGKSTLAGTERYIDLESGNFWVDGERDKNWFIPYCNIANHLSEQGYNVFTSSHEVVRKQLKNYNQVKVLVYPSLELKDEWIQRLQKRYDDSQLDKDYKALMNAKDRYEENIKELMREEEFVHIVIDSMNYSLDDLLQEMCEFFEKYEW